MPKYMGQGMAEKLGRLTGLAPEDQDVVAYGLEYLLISITGPLLALLLGLVLGLFSETCAVILSWMILRPSAGGAHCTSRWRCIVASCLGVIAVVFLAAAALALVSALTWAVLCSIWTMAAVWLWAPNNSARPISDPQRRRRLRRRAMILAPLACMLIICLSLSGSGQIQSISAAGAAGLAAGALILSPAGFQLMAWCDKTLKAVTLSQRR